MLLARWRRSEAAIGLAAATLAEANAGFAPAYRAELHRCGADEQIESAVLTYMQLFRT
jgi:hypothetical protein